MGKIFYLMGKSSSGKDTIYKRLMADTSLGLKNIVLYTTRPIRQGERDGVEYYFVSEDRLSEFLQSQKVIEMREYDTCCGVWKYFTVDTGEVDPGRQSYLMIGTLESFVRTRDYYGADQVVPLLIELDDGIRLQRALDRERGQDHPKYSEMCRRFLADEADFSPEKRSAAGITREFVNEDLEQCLLELREYIRRRQ